MSGTVARITLKPGHRLTEIVLFKEEQGDAADHDVSGAMNEPSLRRLMQGAGFWPRIRRRPFGGMPAPDERPAAIFVMAVDTRPHAPDPMRAVAGREDTVRQGLEALSRLTEGPVFVVRAPGARIDAPELADRRIRFIDCGQRHPQGLPGIRIHAAFPAALDYPVWDLHIEDVAALGALVETGRLETTRLVNIAGEALREAVLVRTQIGADLRGLTIRLAAPGGNLLLSGSPLDGHEAHWLDVRDRQVSVLPRPERAPKPHWLAAALTRSARPAPVIPNAALSQAFGASLPAAAFIRALAAGDDETTTKMGLLSFLEEDVALADYVLGGEADLAGSLRTVLDRIRTEFAA
jgi:Na+-transporting NADH:ubiquinone oxidoreductase subunit A